MMVIILPSHPFSHPPRSPRRHRNPPHRDHRHPRIHAVTDFKIPPEWFCEFVACADDARYLSEALRHSRV